MAERFDRWIANPEQIALPQNFDEFLARNVLTCPVIGCEWEGEHLGYHANIEHGITAREFKKLCGFNLKTGLIGQELSQWMSDKAKQFIEDGIWPSCGPVGHQGTTPKNIYISLESKEHQQKSRAEMPLLKDVFLLCRQCGASVQQQAFGRKLYCSTKCRSKWYSNKVSVEQICAYCGTVFMGNTDQSRRAKKGLPVCCSLECRNRLNIAAALSVRGITRPQPAPESDATSPVPPG